MRENLLGFVLQALDADEQQAVQEALRNDPQLNEELARLQASVAPLQCDQELWEPPAGLAQRTCEMILATPAMPQVELATAASGVSSGHSRGWTLADLVVAAGICASAAFLFFPAIAHSRFQAQLAQCRFNLSQIGLGAVNYDMQHGHFPRIPSSGRLAAAGLYAPVLFSEGYLTDPRVLVCPGSALAQESAGFRVPALEELEAADDVGLRTLKHSMGGSYGYSLGYVSDGECVPVHNQQRSQFAIAGDAPSDLLAGHQSANHGGSGQNVLFECGRVQYLKNCMADCIDDVYLSDRKLVEAGRHANDAVLGASDAVPLPAVLAP